MPKKKQFDATSLSRLDPGAWRWDGGIGYRRHQSGKAGTWYIKYRSPAPGHYPEGLKPITRQVKERLPNCRNRSQAEG